MKFIDFISSWTGGLNDKNKFTYLKWCSTDSKTVTKVFAALRNTSWIFWYSICVWRLSSQFDLLLHFQFFFKVHWDSPWVNETHFESIGCTKDTANRKDIIPQLVCFLYWQESVVVE
jgi:hypothetical protein